MEECLTVFVLADQTDPKLTTKLKYYRNASFLGPRTKCQKKLFLEISTSLKCFFILVLRVYIL